MQYKQELVGYRSTYRKIKSRLVARVGNEWTVGTRLPTIQMIARQLKAGQRNTHRAVRELVAEGVLASAPRRGTFVISTKPATLALPTNNQGGGVVGKCAGKTVRIMFPGPDKPDEMVNRMARAFKERMELTGCRITQQQRDHEQQNNEYRGFRDDALVIVQPQFHPIIAGEGQIVMAIGTTASVRFRIPGRYDLVTIDEDQGGLLAGESVRKAGWDTAVFLGVSHPDNPNALDNTSLARLRGFESGFGRSIRVEHQLICESYDPGCGAGAVVAYLHLTPGHPAIFAASDDLAIGFVLGAISHGLVPGRDYSIVGFDGQHWGQRMVHGPLTHVAVPVAEMGHRAAELLTDRLADPDRPPQRIELGCRFVQGKTLGSQSVKSCI